MRARVGVDVLDLELSMTMPWCPPPVLKAWRNWIAAGRSHSVLRQAAHNPPCGKLLTIIAASRSH